MIPRILTLLLFQIVFCFADEGTLRHGKSKECYLFSFGKGPDWITAVDTEFQLNHLNQSQPFVDDQFFDPTPEALGWIESHKKPKIEEIARFQGRKIIRINYSHQEKHQDILDLVMLAIETEVNSEWFSPFFVASPEYFCGRFISGRDVAFGFMATLEYSGTGSFRTHHLFDLAGEHPKLVRTVHAGRVRRIDFDSDEEYEEALKVFEAEKQIYKGEQNK